MMFREGTFEDGLSILADLREAQCKTLEKLTLDPEELLRGALAGGPATTVLINDRPAAMFGTLSMTLLGITKIWLITTPAVEREPKAFLRWSRRFTADLYEQHGTLFGVVDAEFERSCRWLQWCGFTKFREGDFIIMRYSGGH